METQFSNIQVFEIINIKNPFNSPFSKKYSKYQNYYCLFRIKFYFHHCYNKNKRKKYYFEIICCTIGTMEVPF